MTFPSMVDAIYTAHDTHRGSIALPRRCERCSASVGMHDDCSSLVPDTPHPDLSAWTLDLIDWWMPTIEID